jgi:hypothetical protein
LKAGWYQSSNPSSYTIPYATSLLYFIGAFIIVHVEIGASKVMVIVLGMEILNDAQVIFHAVSLTSKT